MPDPAGEPPSDSIGRPDPAADLMDAEADAWSRYRARLDADPADRDAWRAITDEIAARRHAIDWPARKLGTREHGLG